MAKTLKKDIRPYYYGWLYSSWLTEASWAPYNDIDLTEDELAGSTEEGTLTLNMVNGSRYIYLDVPAWVWSGLVVAASPGRFFGQHIRDVYPYAAV